jgi:hypothetical protein
MKRFFALASFAAALAAGAFAQSPIIVQPANAPAAVQPRGTPAKTDDDDLVDAIKSLQEMKAANEELLQKQQATLQALDELQKQADQLRIYSKRS